MSTGRNEWRVRAIQADELLPKKCRGNLLRGAGTLRHGRGEVVPRKVMSRRQRRQVVARQADAQSPPVGVGELTVRERWQVIVDTEPWQGARDPLVRFRLYALRVVKAAMTDGDIGLAIFNKIKRRSASAAEMTPSPYPKTGRKTVGPRASRTRPSGQRLTAPPGRPSDGDTLGNDNKPHRRWFECGSEQPRTDTHLRRGLH